jgi:hypothetical protein
MPLVELSDVFTPSERHEYGMGQKTELRLALFNFNF